MAEIIGVDFSGSRIDSVSEYLACIRKLENQLTETLFELNSEKQKVAVLSKENNYLRAIFSQMRSLLPQDSVPTRKGRRPSSTVEEQGVPVVVFSSSKKRKTVPYKLIEEALEKCGIRYNSTPKDISLKTGIAKSNIVRWRSMGIAPEAALNAINSIIRSQNA